MKDRGASILCFLFGISIIIGIVGFPGCQTGRPRLDIKLWAGDSAQSGITRSQAPSGSLSCKDPKFDDYVCMSFEDYKTLRHSLKPNDGD